MPGRAPPVTRIVHGKLPPPDTPALTGMLAAALQRAVDRDAGLRAAWLSLQRSDVVLEVRLEVAGPGAPPRVVVEALAAGVPQWSRDDREVLHSLGIATDVDEQPRTSEPGRRQPR
jgi:hypothetical protein